MIRATGISVRYPGMERSALDGVSLALGARELVAVVGPNGSGKTTLLRALLGTAPLSGGSVEIGGRPLGQWRIRELAREVAVVPQREEQLYPLKVGETAALGRYARLGPFEAEGPEDRRAIEGALERCDLGGLVGRRTDTLSGGEWQRVRIARALAQEPKVLVLDEPTASLDVRHEMEVFELIRGLAEQGTAALIATHQLNLAARFADRLVLLQQGRLVAEGPPRAVLDPRLLTRVFAWPVTVGVIEEGVPQVIPLRAGRVGLEAAW
jgi:iron complex transport system ATP-binding protein